jgi:hypothetical protein
MHSTRRVLAGEQSRAFQLQVFETSFVHIFAIFRFNTFAVQNTHCRHAQGMFRKFGQRVIVVATIIVIFGSELLPLV